MSTSLRRGWNLQQIWANSYPLSTIRFSYSVWYSPTTFHSLWLYLWTYVRLRSKIAVRLCPSSKERSSSPDVFAMPLIPISYQPIVCIPPPARAGPPIGTLQGLLIPTRVPDTPHWVIRTADRLPRRRR